MSAVSLANQLAGLRQSLAKLEEKHRRYFDRIQELAKDRSNFHPFWGSPQFPKPVVDEMGVLLREAKSVGTLFVTLWQQVVHDGGPPREVWQHCEPFCSQLKKSDLEEDRPPIFIWIDSTRSLLSFLEGTHTASLGIAGLCDTQHITQESKEVLVTRIAEVIRATDRQATSITVENLSMGDTNINYGKAGIVGSGKARDIIQNDWHAHKGSIDLSALALELANLRAAMRKEGTTTEQDKAIVAVGSAEEAAKQKDGESVFGYLRQAGKWALDTATKIGTTVAVDAIKKATGL